MPRWLRIVLAIVAALAGAYAGLIVIGGAAAGIAWLYLFGDDPWPKWGEWLIGAFMVAGLAAGAIGAGRAAWRMTGRA